MTNAQRFAGRLIVPLLKFPLLLFTKQPMDEAFEWHSELRLESRLESRLELRLESQKYRLAVNAHAVNGQIGVSGG